MPDSYIRALLKQSVNELKGNNISSATIGLKREQLLLYREIKQLKKEVQDGIN